MRVHVRARVCVSVCVGKDKKEREKERNIGAMLCILCMREWKCLRVQHETQLEQKDVSRENSDARLSKEGSENQ